MKELEDIYGIAIDNSDYFKTALTHPSYTQEHDLPYKMNYERLEFLGDAVLKLLTSRILYAKYPEYSEGELSKIRSVVVSDETLAKIAKDMGLCEHIIVAGHEKKTGTQYIESVCACAFEAVLGAFYLDGKLEKVLGFLERVLVPVIEEVDGNFASYNAKAILQEYTQSVDKTRPVYKVVNTAGAQHNKTFFIEVSFQDKVIAHGEGKSKKDAEQQAAFNACKELGVIK